MCIKIMRQTARRDGLFHTQPKVLEEEASLTVVHTHLYIRPSALDLLRWLFYIYTGFLSLSLDCLIEGMAPLLDGQPQFSTPIRQ